MRNRLGNFLRRLGENDRSPDWPTMRRNFLKAHPVCWECGSFKDLEVHHIRPFHLYPELELKADNLITLCETVGINCHFNVGHLGNWKGWNPELLGMARI